MRDDVLSDEKRKCLLETEDTRFHFVCNLLSALIVLRLALSTVYF